MSEKLPISLLEIADKNRGIIDALNLSPKPADIEASRAYGEIYMIDRYGVYGSPSKLREEHIFPSSEDEKKRLKLSAQLINEFNMAFLLVRPEMYHHAGSIIDFLQERNFSVIYDDERIITPNMYYTMYSEIFGNPDAKDSWPTRTMVYLDSPTRLVIFVDTANRFDGGTSLADGFVYSYKGFGGVKDTNTIRGSVVFEEAYRLGFHTLKNHDMSLALDPIVAYRHIVAQKGSNYSHSHLPPDIALLNYTAVSVHIPNGDEIVRDLSVLNSQDELSEIFYELVS